MIWIGVDTGGTFTDLICVEAGEVRVHKVLSDPDSPDRAIAQGIAELNLTEAVARGSVQVIHGTTVATNAALENKGAPTLFISNKGFSDLLSIGRQARAELYNLCPPGVAAPVPPALCRGLNTRVDASGREIEPLDVREMQQLVQQLDPAVKAVAVCFLFAYLNPAAERAVKAALPESLFVSLSSDVLPEYREYERALATWLNASLGPVMSSYLLQLQRQIPPARLAVMQSSGGTISAAQAAGRAVDLLLSGPAGGLAAARSLAAELGLQRLLTLDMGGTSTDVAMVDQDIRLTTEGRIGPYPVAVPMVDMHSIGAGGGSLAYVDEAGMLHVGPQSAGANPGPACYGQGGDQATVTDAHLCLGTLPAHLRLAGSLPLDGAASRRAIQRLAHAMGMESAEQVAAGIIALANEHMAQALRVISEQRGLDPRQFSLCSFGGAGALHVCDLAEMLGIQRALVPRYAGIYSALGMLLAPRLRKVSQGIQRCLDSLQQDQLDAWVESLDVRGRAELLAEGVEDADISRHLSMDCRYQGQSFPLRIAAATLAALTEAFHQAHERVYGYRLERPVELVTLRLSLRGPAPQLKLPDWQGVGNGEPERLCSVALVHAQVPCYDRDNLKAGQIMQGPALICEAGATLWLKPEWTLQVSKSGHLQLQRTQKSPD